MYIFCLVATVAVRCMEPTAKTGATVAPDVWTLGTFSFSIILMDVIHKKPDHGSLTSVIKWKLVKPYH